MVGMRFTIKAMLFATTLVAAYSAVVGLGPTTKGLAAYLLFSGLIVYSALSPKNNPQSAH